MTFFKFTEITSKALLRFGFSGVLYFAFFKISEVIPRNTKFLVNFADDLSISADFFDYFRWSSTLLDRDPTLWCVSAWNDNGKRGLIDQKRSDLFWRTDFFPGKVNCSLMKR